MAGDVLDPKTKRNERMPGDKAKHKMKEQSIEDWFKDPTPPKKFDIVTVDNPYEVLKTERNPRPGKPDGKEVK